MKTCEKANQGTCGPNTTAVTRNIRQACADGSTCTHGRCDKPNLYVIEKMTQVYSQVGPKNTVYCDTPVHADGDGHPPAHQVSSNWGLKPSSPKHQDICQALLRSQQAELRWDDSSIFGRHGITQHKKQSYGYPESLPDCTDDDADPESDHGEELPIETSQEMDDASRMAVVDGMSEVQLMGKA